jgi:putrescine aminotransferase
MVGEVRGLGLLAAIELVQDKQQRRSFPDPGTVGTACRNFCFNDGLICRAIRDTMVLAPPLVISESEVDEIVVKLKSAIDRTARDGAKF